MSLAAFDDALARLKDALTHAPEQITAANLALRVQVDRLRHNPHGLSPEQIHGARKQLHAVAELARLRQHGARRLQQALQPAEVGAYGRRG